MESKAWLVRFCISAYKHLGGNSLRETRTGNACFRFLYYEYKRRLEDPYFAFGKRHPELFQGGHILDIGANIGYTSQVFARLLSQNYKIFAFEPEERNFKYLSEESSRRRNIGKIRPFRLALSNREGTDRLWITQEHPGDHHLHESRPEDNSNNHTTFQTIPVTTVDRFVESHGIQGHIRFIKIDVQGYELQVCKGMHRVLDHPGNRQLSVAIEIDQRCLARQGTPLESIFHLFTSRGFLISHIRKNGTLQRIDLESNLGEIHALLESNGGYSDFLFHF